MKHTLLMIGLLIMITQVLAQNHYPGLVGKWKYINGIEGKELDCPDIIEFYANGKFSVLNDCYATNFEFPETESGEWSYNTRTKIVTITKRCFYSNYCFLDSFPIINIRLIGLNDSLLTIGVNKSKSVTEMYLRIPVTDFMETISGVGTAHKELNFSKEIDSIRISYNFYKEPDQMLILNQNGKLIFATEVMPTLETKRIIVPLESSRKLIIQIKNENPKSRWKVKFDW